MIMSHGQLANWRSRKGIDEAQASEMLFRHLPNGFVEVLTGSPAQEVTSTSSTHEAALGLGDYVASALFSIGITKERVAAIVGGPCGCSERAEKLNQLGRKIGIG